MVNFLKSIGFKISHKEEENYHAHYIEGDYEIIFRKMDHLVCIGLYHGPFEFVRDETGITIAQDLQVEFLSNPFIKKYYSALYYRITEYRIPKIQQPPS